MRHREWLLESTNQLAVFENGQFARALRKNVYRLEMTDFGTRSYTMKAL